MFRRHMVLPWVLMKDNNLGNLKTNYELQMTNDELLP